MTTRSVIFPFYIIFVFLLILFQPVVDARAQGTKKILSLEAYDMLNTVPDTYLIDIRTRGEYQFVGHPLNAYHFPYIFFTSTLITKDGKQGYAINAKNKAFLAEINKAFKKSDNLLIISRDGERSALAAKDLFAAGFKKVVNVWDGFEGGTFPSFPDQNKYKYYRQLAKRNKPYGFGHRRREGWQWWGLPWNYEIDPKFAYPPDVRSPKK